MAFESLTSCFSVERDFIYKYRCFYNFSNTLCLFTILQFLIETFRKKIDFDKQNHAPNNLVFQKSKSLNKMLFVQKNVRNIIKATVYEKSQS